MVHGDVATAPLRVSRASKHCRGQVLVDPLDRVLGECNRFGAHRIHPDLVDQGDHVAHRLESDHGRGATEPAAHPFSGLVALPHLERFTAAEPSLNRLAQLTLEVATHLDERGRARSAVQVLVAAADGEVDAPVVERCQHGADRVREIPDCEPARGVYQRRDCLDLGEETATVGHEREQSQTGRLLLGFLTNRRSGWSALAVGWNGSPSGADR